MDKRQVTDPFTGLPVKEDTGPRLSRGEEAGAEQTQKQTASREKAERKESKSREEDEGKQKDADHKKTWAPYIATLLIILLFTVVIYTVLYSLTLKSIARDMKKTLDHVAESYHEGEEKWESYEQEVNLEYERLLAAIALHMNRDKSSSKAMLLEKYMDTKFFANLLVVNKTGDIEASAYQTSLDFHENKSEKLYQLIQLKEDTSQWSYVPEGKDGTTQGMPRFYSCLLADNTVLVAEVQCDILDQISMHRSSWKAQMNLVSTRMDGFVMVQSAKNGDIIYGSDKADVFREARKKEYRVLWPSDGLGVTNVDGQEYYTVTLDVNKDIKLTAVLAKSTLRANILYTVLAMEVIFVIIVMIMLIYSIYASNSQRKGKADGWKKLHRRYYNKEIGKRLILCALLGMLVIGMITYYVQTLFSVTGNARNSERCLTRTMNALEDSESDVTDARRFVNSVRREFCSVFLEDSDYFEGMTRDDLLKTEFAIIVDSINIYNMEGENVLHSLYFLDYDKEDVKKKIHEVTLAMWTDDYYLGDIEDSYNGYKVQEIAKIIRNKKGQEYLIVIKMEACRLPEHLQEKTLEETLRKVNLSNDGFAFAINKEDKTYSYYPQEDMIGQNIRNYNVNENRLHDGYTGALTMAGDKYITSIGENDDHYIGVAINRSRVLLGRIPATLVSGGASLLCLLVLFLMLAFRGENITGVAEPAFMKKMNKGKSAEAMTIKIIKDLLLEASILVSMVAVFRKYLFPENSLLLYALDGNWTHGLNIFSMTVSIINIAEGVLVIVFVRTMLDLLEDTFSTRGATICRLCSGLIKYLGAILIIYKCVANFGVNTGTLLTSAGILGTVVGLGANSLLADIFAGLFIIFEGDLQVSDMVEFDDFVGYIEEIGIRTTKIRNVDHNTKILNNKDITRIIDRARKYNYCHVYVMVNHKESLERIEALLARDLPGFADRFPFLIGVPEYRGISSLTDGGMTLDIRFKTHPRYVMEVQYEMNREIQKLFASYDIELNIPYVMNQLNTEALPGTDADAAQAEEYLKKRWNKRGR